MTTRRVTALLLAAAVLTALQPAAAEPIEGTMLPLPLPDGWAMLPDGVTLVVAQGEKGQLVYFDTVAEREAKRVDVDFKPGPMAAQGNTLFVGAKGSSVVYALDAKTGKLQKEIPLGGDAVVALACHPAKGAVYASTTTYKVYAIDPAAGTAAKTRATGSFLAVDPVTAAALYTGVQPPRDFREVFIEDLPDGRVKVFVDRWGARGFILKYEVKGKELKLVSTQKNAAAGGHGLAVTPDGKKVLMLGGAWHPPVEGGTGGGHAVAFSADNLESMVGEAPGGTDVAFHPVLNLGVVNREGRAVQLFNPKSLVLGTRYEVAKGADERAVLVTFAGKGTKVVLWNGDNPKNPQEGLHFLQLPLSAGDRAAVEKVYGKLPPTRPPVAVVPTPVKKADPTLTTPAPVKKADPGTSPDQTAGPPGGVIAAAGFNMKKGLNVTPGGPAAYPLGQSNAQGGFGERGWKGVWPAGPNATFVTDPVYEGDGAVKLTGTVGFARDFAREQTGTFSVEAVVRVPGGGGGGCYVQNTSAEDSAAMWTIDRGKLKALNGNGGGGGNWEVVGDFPADTWKKVAVVVDVPARKWVMEFDGKRVPKQFGFRGRPSSVQRVSYLVEGSAVMYLDAIRVIASPPGGIAVAPVKGDDPTLTTLTPMKKGDPTLTTPTPMKKATPPPPTPDLTKKAEPPPGPVPPGGVIAATGFNATKGLGTGNGAQPPYPVGKANVLGGYGEPGWSGAWPAKERTEYVADPVFEGDGALKLTGTAQCGRAWSRPQTGKFTVEAMIRVPAGGGGRAAAEDLCSCYVWETNHTNTASMWRVAGGMLKAMDGDGRGDGRWRDVGPFRPDVWHKVAVEIDVPAKKWALDLDGKRVLEQYGFRGNPAALREVNYLVEGRAVMYVDAVRVIAGGP